MVLSTTLLRYCAARCPDRCRLPAQAPQRCWRRSCRWSPSRGSLAYLLLFLFSARFGFGPPLDFHLLGIVVVSFAVEITELLSRRDHSFRQKAGYRQRLPISGSEQGHVAHRDVDPRVVL